MGLWALPPGGLLMGQSQSPTPLTPGGPAHVTTARPQGGSESLPAPWWYALVGSGYHVLLGEQRSLNRRGT